MAYLPPLLNSHNINNLSGVVRNSSASFALISLDRRHLDERAFKQ